MQREQEPTIGQVGGHAQGQGGDAPGRTPLLPDRHPTADFFICDVLDAIPKDDMASMEHPIFSLSTKPDMKRRRYETGSNFVEVHPSDRGIATVYQDLAMIPLMSIARNFFLGAEPTVRWGPFQQFDMKRASRIAQEELGKLGIDIRDATQPVGTLSGGERQSVAIARAIAR